MVTKEISYDISVTNYQHQLYCCIFYHLIFNQKNLISWRHFLIWRPQEKTKLIPYVTRDRNIAINVCLNQWIDCQKWIQNVFPVFWYFCKRSKSYEHNTKNYKFQLFWYILKAAWISWDFFSDSKNVLIICAICLTSSISYRLRDSQVENRKSVQQKTYTYYCKLNICVKYV